MSSLNKIKMFAFDVDGTLTPGILIFGPEGEAYKVFNSHDGLMLNLVRKLGFKVGFITGRNSPLVEVRAKELHVDFVMMGVKDKVAALSEKLAEYGMKWDEVAYMGDDLNDLPILSRSGYSGCPANACNENRGLSDFVSHYNGGEGAAREFMEDVLKRQGRWEEAVNYYMKK